MEALTQDIALIELHDARLSKLELRPGGLLLLHWDHLVVFLRRERELFDVWSISAKLHVEGVKSLRVTGVLSADDLVADGAWSQDGVEVDPTRMLALTSVNLGRLTFQSGASLECSCSSAQVVDLVQRELLEPWSGPL